jgi:hypothetical protein
LSNLTIWFQGFTRIDQSINLWGYLTGLLIQVQMQNDAISATAKACIDHPTAGTEKFKPDIT